MKTLAFCVAAVSMWAVAGFADQNQIQVAGIVRSAKTGDVLRNAVVMLSSGGAGRKFSRATTGADGSFGLSGLPAGQYQLAIWKPGYQTLQGNTPIIILRDSAAVTRLTPSLWPNAAVHGRVVDWEGEPLPEAEVRAYAIVFDRTGAALSLAAKADCNDLGEYRLFDLPAGKYLLQVSAPRGGTPSGQFYADTPATYYPGVPAPGQALPIELNWGDERERVDVTISRGQSYVIAGGVWDAMGERPCTRCLVQAVQHDGVYRISLPQAARVAPNGAFVLRGLSSGDYSLVVRQGSSKDAVAQTSASIRRRHVEDARLVVGLQQAVTGQIVLENAPEGIDVTDWMPRLAPVAAPEWWPRAEGRVNLNRQFAIEGVPPARYRFELSGLPAGAYLKALRAGGQSLANTEILVPAEAAVTGVQAVIAFDSATVQGRVRSPGSTEVAQSPVARVFLIPSQSQTAFRVPRSTETSADGSFALGSVAPGSYTLYALPATATLQIFDPAVQAALAKYTIQINLEPKQGANIEIPLVPQPN